MKTFGEMVEETKAHLRNFVRDQEMSTHLDANVNDNDIEIVVNDASIVSRGRIEIDDELIWVDRVERANNKVIIPPYGRGMDGTTKAPHPNGARVIVQPLYPRSTVKSMLNQAITTMGEKLYGLQEVTLTVSPTNFLYELPLETRSVVEVKTSYRNRRPGDDVRWLRDWQFDKHAPMSVAPSGKGLYVYDSGCSPTDTLTVTITRDPVPLNYDLDQFAGTLLPPTAWDVAVLLAASRLIAMANTQNIVGRSVEANTLDSKVEARAGQDQSKYLYGMAQARLDEERKRLLNNTNQKPHFTGRKR